MFSYKLLRYFACALGDSVSRPCLPFHQPVYINILTAHLLEFPSTFDHFSCTKIEYMSDPLPAHILQQCLAKGGGGLQGLSLSAAFCIGPSSYGGIDPFALLLAACTAQACTAHVSYHGAH
jgi:hypothetical protein